MRLLFSLLILWSRFVISFRIVQCLYDFNLQIQRVDAFSIQGTLILITLPDKIGKTTSGLTILFLLIRFINVLKQKYIYTT